ncbi:patatin-like phospholipase family protein [Microbaculum marinisediminis]|uniref:Patatin-like phospholipase domain-containing protein n=1 Tax=Microbaculum marinisediminis TaxID=2931392 RepID=A0AAW5QYY1_9HYPH|nr:cyclic nucleotide-binding and patatin-like phospholipase domain-containing protein [Microbaculum sp. A6E488]MCT8973127.1 patatin-like phospholipase domain-containing protein [Microbaculum sp. A6E488]
MGTVSTLNVRGSDSVGARRDGDRSYPRLARALRCLEPFRSLSRRSFADVARMVELRCIARGQVLFERGDPSDTLYLVASGRFFVFIDADQDPVAEIGVGEPVGDLAFLTGQPRTATVVAARDSEVIAVSRTTYQQLFERVPLLQEGLLVRLAERMQTIAATARPPARSPGRTIALCPVGLAPIPHILVKRLEAALAQYGPTQVLRPDPVPDPAADHGAAAIDIRLSNLERDCRFVLCPLPVPEADGAERAELLLRQCDSVVLVGRLGDAAVPGRDRLERTCADLFLTRNRSLILWRETSTTPIAGTPAWLARHKVALHHHVALDAPGDAERVARFLAGRAVGAVFGGGGALGCGHLGLARAFRDAGMAFDIFGGTSAGAAMALTLAAGKRPEDVMDRIDEIFVRKRALRRFTLPVFSFLDHTVFERELVASYGNADIADLPLNAFAVSTNLSRDSLHVHRTGPIWQAIRSSGAVPGALPPFTTEEGDLLVDGALVDNLPVSVMRDLKIGPNVLAGFFREDRRPRGRRYDPVPGRERLIADIVLQRRRSFPSLFDVLSRAMLVTSRRSLRETEIGSDLLVSLPVPDRMGLLDWKSGRAQEERCYRYVSRLIEEAGGPMALIEQAQRDRSAVRP